MLQADDFVSFRTSMDAASNSAVTSPAHRSALRPLDFTARLDEPSSPNIRPQ